MLKQQILFLTEAISSQHIILLVNFVFPLPNLIQLNFNWREINNKVKMSHDILEIQGRKPLTEEPKTGEKADPVQQEDVDCVDSKIVIWDGDDFQEFESDFLNQIYPYKISKKSMTPGSQFIFHFLSSSLHYWVELVQEGEQEPNRLGKKDIKLIEQILRTDQSDNCIAFHRWGQNFNKKDDFYKHEEAEENFVEPKGELIHTYKRGEDQFIINKYYGSDKAFLDYKKRIQVLFLFYIDGVSFVFEEIDTWVYYVIFKKNAGGKRKTFVGVLSEYIFKISTLKERHRISQVFIMPSYQKSGHGKELIDSIYDISLKDPKCFEITTEIPSFQYQCLRDFKQIEMLLESKIMNISQMKKVVNKNEIDLNRSLLLTKENVRLIKEKLKIPGHQIERLTNILIYYKILGQNDDMAQAHFDEDLRQRIIENRSPFKTRRKLPNITFYGQVPVLKTFLLEKAKEQLLRNNSQVQQILLQTLSGFNRVVSKLKKVKLLP